MVDIVVFQEETDPQKFEFDTFEEAAAEARLHLVPEIADAIDFAVSAGDGTRYLTEILRNLCSPDDDLVVEAIDEWRKLVVENRLGTLWIELRQ